MSVIEHRSTSLDEVVPIRAPDQQASATPVPVLACQLAEGGRIWPLDCEEWTLPLGQRSPALHVLPTNYLSDDEYEPFIANNHYIPRVSMFNSEYGIYVVDEDASGSEISAALSACVIRRAGFTLTAGDMYLVDDDDISFVADRPSDLRIVNDTHAVLSYGYAKPASGSEAVIALVKRTGMDLEVVDRYVSDQDDDVSLQYWSDLSRVPESDRFLAVYPRMAIAIGVDGDTLTVAEHPYSDFMDSCDDYDVIFDVKVACVDPDGRFVIGGYPYDSTEYEFVTGRLHENLSVTWGTRPEWTETDRHFNPFGSTDPLLARLGLQPSAVITYRAAHSGVDEEPNGCTFETPFKFEQSRAMRLDINDDLSVTQWPVIPLDAQPNSQNTAPSAIRESATDGSVAVTFDTAQYYGAGAAVGDPADSREVHEVLTIWVDESADSGLAGYMPFNSQVKFRQFFWGIDIDFVPDTNFMIIAGVNEVNTDAGPLTPSGDVLATYNTDTNTLITPEETLHNGENLVGHDGSMLYIVACGDFIVRRGAASAAVQDVNLSVYPRRASGARTLA